MKLLLTALLAIFAAAESQKSERICQPYTTFKYYCNTCTCLSDGKTKYCTTMYCDPRDWNEDGTRKWKPSDRSKVDQIKKVCESRSTFKDYCNTCMCSEDGTYVSCTLRVCDARIWNEDGSLKAGQTLITDPDQACRPYSYFIDYCNTCKCTASGRTAVCTKKICDSKYLNKDGTPKKLTESRTGENHVYDSDRIIFKD